MASLTHCFEVHRIHPVEQQKIRSMAEAYRKEGFLAQEANERAVQDFIRLLEEERQSILTQIKDILQQQAKQAPTTALTTAQASQRIADWVYRKLANRERFTKADLFDQADDAFGGTKAEGQYTAKDAFDAMELGVNQYLARETWDDARKLKKFTPTVKAETAERMVDIIRDEILDLLPSQMGLRTEETDEFQQFSTPPDFAFVLNWVANINPQDIMLEPSAGVGGLAVFAKNAGAKTIVNELSPRRANLLKQLGFDKVYTENAEQLHNILPKDEKVTVVVMNPPFSATAGRIEGQRKTLNATRHIDQALQRLEPNGRLVALMGKGFHEQAANLKEWWLQTLAKYNVRANILIEGTGYTKYGTSYDNRLIVIDKTGPTTGEIIRGEVQDVKEVIPILEGVRNERGQVSYPSQVGSQPRSREVTQESGRDTGGELPTSISVDVVGPETGAQPVRGKPGLRGPRGTPGVQPKPGGVPTVPDAKLAEGEEPHGGGLEAVRGTETSRSEATRTPQTQGESGPPITPPVSVEVIEGAPPPPPRPLRVNLRTIQARKSQNRRGCPSSR